MPESVCILNSTLTSIAIEWNELKCIEQNSDITGYVIRLNQEVIENVSSDTREFTVAELFPSTEYIIEIAADSINGTGPIRSINGSTLQPAGIIHKSFSSQTLNLSMVIKVCYKKITEAGLLLRGRHLQNNSAIIWMEIGVGRASLLCITNKTDCCNDEGASGQWISPKGTAIPSTSGSAVVQQYGMQSVRLENQRHLNRSDTGIIYLCNITDAENKSKHFYVGIYSDQIKSKHNNMIHGCKLKLFLVVSLIFTVVIVSITFNLKDPIHLRFELTCTSVGRPVDQMVWMVNGTNLSNSSSYPILNDTTSGTYYSTAVIYGREIGNYSCHVTDDQEIIGGPEYHVVSGKCKY